MNTLRPYALGTLLLAAVSAPAIAQLQAPQPLPLMHVPIHTADDDMGTPYGIWGAAESYKASFHDGMTFVPYLGAQYPHNQPWSWRTSSATVGGVPLFEAGAVPEHVQREYRYEYHFGAVTEAYDVRQDGLEQTFVISHLPARGDLVITGEVTSALRTAACEPTQRALTFVDANGTGIVGYGEAWAIDADGVRTPVTTAHQGGRITLTVAGDWLARAALPVVVDPLLTRVQVGSGGVGVEVRTVEIGRDDYNITRNVMVVSVYSASQFDEDVHAHLCNDDFSAAVGIYFDITTSYESEQATCAYVGGSDRWVIAFRRHFSQNPTRVSRLRCHVHNGASTTASTSISGMATPAGTNEWRPDVGGVGGFYGGTDALVVYQREDNPSHFAETDTSQLYAVLFDTTTTNGTFGSPSRITPTITGSRDWERPTVTQVSHDSGWVCCAQVYDNTLASPWNLFARRIAPSGALSSFSWIAAGSATPEHRMTPSIDGSFDRHAITYATVSVAMQPTKSANIRGTSVWVQRLDWPTSLSSQPTAQAPVELLSDAARIYEAGGIAQDNNDDSHYAIGCRTLGVAQPSAIGMRVGFRGHLTEGPFVLHSQAGTSATRVACTFNDDNSTFLFAYGVTGGTTEPAYGRLLYYLPVTADQPSGFGCSSATIRWDGNQQIGAEHNALRIVGAPTASLHIMLASTASLDLPVLLSGVEPGCRLLVDVFGPGYIGILDARAGASVSWTIPLLEWFTPTTLYFQDWILDGGQLSSTQRLAVPIVQ